MALILFLRPSSTSLAFPSRPTSTIIPCTRGRLASTGLVKELQRAQVQVPGKTVWNDLTANNELALAA
jgi:hypothetical protein